MDKIAKWAGNNKTKFKERKSKIMLITRRKRKEHKEIAIYLNNNLSHRYKILIIWD